MSQWETCEIKLVVLRQGNMGFFKSTPDICRWEAQKMPPANPEIVSKTGDFEFGRWSNSQESYKHYENRNTAYKHLIAHLTSEGWEPAATNENGEITLMKRTKVFQNIGNDVVSRVEQMVNLYRIGKLTDEEFKEGVKTILGL